MKLYGSLTSPFVRGCRIAALELDLAVEFEPTVVKPTEPNRAYGAEANPLRRVPALMTDEGEALVDSRVILEHFDNVGGGRLIPAQADERVACLNRHAVVAGATEALVSAMYETRFRPEPLRWGAWAEDQVDKAQAALDWVEARADAYGAAFDIAAIGLVCLAGYAAFRFPETAWLDGRPAIADLLRACARRESVRDTASPAGA